MILKFYELNKINIINQKYFLFYGNNEGLKKEEISLIDKIEEKNHKNSLLSDNLDLDFVETLIRERFLFGKENETIYIIKKNEN